AFRASAIARNEHELDLWRRAHLVHGADKVCRENEGALQDRDNQQVLVFMRRDFLGQFEVTARDLFNAEQNLDVFLANNRHETSLEKTISPPDLFGGLE